ncbi:MAG: CDP-alcohol phosphatidyltransferase family protein [Acidobacteriota bacterium]|nr:CDP-alcohol phosphatidyltransferase family protein [Acidobacteriota bacterium]
MNLNVPNLVTLIRMGIIPLFVIALLNGESGKALALFVVAGLTDALDGFLARVFEQSSLLGAYLDPIADKLLLTSAYIVLTFPSHNPGQVLVPIWVTVLVLARDVLILVIALVLWMALGQSKFTPTKLSKVNTVAQIVGVVVVLLSGISPAMVAPATVWVYAVAGLTVLSGLDYIYRVNQMVAGSDADA